MDKGSGEWGGGSRLSALIRPGDEDRRRRVNGAWQKVLMMTMMTMMKMMMYIKCRRA